MKIINKTDKKRANQILFFLYILLWSKECGHRVFHDYYFCIFFYRRCCCFDWCDAAGISSQYYMYKYETNNDARYVPLSVLPGRWIDERLTTNECVYVFHSVHSAAVELIRANNIRKEITYEQEHVLIQNETDGKKRCRGREFDCKRRKQEKWKLSDSIKSPSHCNLHSFFLVAE